MRQERSPAFPKVFVDQHSLGRAIVAGLMVFQPEVRDVFAEGEQEGVAAVMPRAKQRARLGRQMGKVPRILRLQCQRRGAVGDDVQRVRRLCARTQINRAKVRAGDER